MRYLLALLIAALMAPPSLVMADNMSEEAIEQSETPLTFNEDNDMTGQTDYEDDPDIDTGDIDEDTTDYEDNE